MNDSEIKAAIQEFFEIQFMNFGGDTLMEGPCNNDEEAYDRAAELLEGASIKIDWIR